MATPAILALYRRCSTSEARLYDDWTIPPLTQTRETLVTEFATPVTLVARRRW